MKRHNVVTDSGIRLCLHQLVLADEPVGAVVLAHGMFSNYRACRGLARYLAELNFECWLLDFQGHGFSDCPLEEPDFESMCLDDTAAVLKFVQAHSRLPLWWVGHSGGGLAILMHLARCPQEQLALAGVVTLASQATDAGFNKTRRAMLRVFRGFVRLLGVVPGKLLRLGPESEFARVMDQWLRWSLSGNWCGKDGFDYSQFVADIKLPSLSIAAVADRFIAPVSGCEKLHHMLGGNDKTFVLCGKGNGFQEDYTHSRLVSSRNASVDVWPLVGWWLIDRTARQLES